MKSKISSKRASRYYLDCFCKTEDEMGYKLYRLPAPTKKKFFYWVYPDGRKPDKYIMTFKEFLDLCERSCYLIYETLKEWKEDMYDV